MPIRTGELERLRERQEANLPDLGQVSRKTRATDGAGGTTETWANVGLECACRIGKPDRRTLELAGRLGIVCDVTITFPAEQDAAVGDRVTIHGTVYTITHTSGSGSWETARPTLARNGT